MTGETEYTRGDLRLRIDSRTTRMLEAWIAIDDMYCDW